MENGVERVVCASRAVTAVCGCQANGRQVLGRERDLSSPGQHRRGRRGEKGEDVI